MEVMMPTMTKEIMNKQVSCFLKYSDELLHRLTHEFTHKVCVMCEWRGR